MNGIGDGCIQRISIFAHNISTSALGGGDIAGNSVVAEKVLEVA